MRKPSQLPSARQIAMVAPHPSSIRLSLSRGALAVGMLVLTLSGCNRGEKTAHSTAVTDSGGRDVGPALIAESRAMRGKMSADEPQGIVGQIAASPPSVEMAQRSGPAAFPAAPALASVNADASTGASAGATGSGFARGVPLPAVDATGAMLVRHGQASVQVKGVDDAVVRVRQAAAQFGGFVANTSLRTGKDEQRSATLELRIPSDKFDGLLSALGALGKVESVSASAEDVAEEYVDLGARLANARRVEARLIEMLATRTGKLSDVLTVEQELSRVRQEAERYDARLRWLERRATLSSLDITIHEQLPLIESHPGPGPIVEAIAEAWSRMVGVFAWCIASLGLIIPLLLLFTAGALLLRRLFRGGRGAAIVG